jgi:hypothetical protein
MYLSELGHSELVQRLFEKMTFFLVDPIPPSCRLRRHQRRAAAELTLHHHRAAAASAAALPLPLPPPCRRAARPVSADPTHNNQIEKWMDGGQHDERGGVDDTRQGGQGPTTAR